MLNDLRQALRRWRARPTTAAAAMLTLALGTGASTAMFSVIDGVLLRPLPWRNPGQLVTVWIVRPAGRTDPLMASLWNAGPLSWPNFTDLKQAGAFEGVAAWTRTLPLVVEGNDVVQPMQISSSFLPVLGVQPYLGRGFTAAEDESPTDVTMISYEAWQRRFGGDRAILGRQITIDEIPRTVVGVLPPRFRFEGDAAEFFVPLGIVNVRDRQRGNHRFRIVARLREDVSLGEAAAAVEPILREGQDPAVRTSRVQRLAEHQLGPSREPLFLLFGASGLLLLIASANVGGLLAGEAGARRSELALRRALGAPKARIVRQLIGEGLVLAIGGGAAGFVAAWWVTPVLAASAPERLPRLETVAVDLRVLAFTVSATVLTTVLFGAVLALALPVGETAGWIRERAASRAGGLFSRLLVAGQVALTVVLLVGASLFGETLIRLRGEALGFDPAGLIVMRLRAPGSIARDPNSRVELEAALLERIRALPGVDSAAGATSPPFSQSYSNNTVQVDGRADSLLADWHVVTPGYFQTMRVPILEGRPFVNRAAAGTPEAVISREFARRMTPDGAIARVLVVGKERFTIVGVAGDTRQREYSDEEQPAYYIPGSAGRGINHVVVRAAGDPRALLPILRETVAQADPRLAVARLETINTLMATTVADERFRALLSSAFGALALLLAAVGLYGIVARSVDERRTEIGIRIAVGARTRDVLRHVGSEGGRLLAAGLSLGVPAAAGTAQLVRAQTHGVEPTDPHTFILPRVS